MGGCFRMNLVPGEPVEESVPEVGVGDHNDTIAATDAALEEGVDRFAQRLAIAVDLCEVSAGGRFGQERHCVLLQRVCEVMAGTPPHGRRGSGQIPLHPKNSSVAAGE